MSARRYLYTSLRSCHGIADAVRPFRGASPHDYRPRVRRVQSAFVCLDYVSCSAFNSYLSCREVVEVGPGVTNLQAGDRVALEPGIPCWSHKLSRYATMMLQILFMRPGLQQSQQSYCVRDTHNQILTFMANMSKSMTVINMKICSLTVARQCILTQARATPRAGFLIHSVTPCSSHTVMTCCGTAMSRQRMHDQFCNMLNVEALEESCSPWSFKSSLLTIKVLESSC